MSVLPNVEDFSTVPKLLLSNVNLLLPSTVVPSQYTVRFAKDSNEGS